VCKTLPKDNALRFLEKTELVKLRKRAMRSGVWFRALRRIDRVLIDLTIKVACIVRSIKLVKSLVTLARKLEGIKVCSLSRAVREVGLPLAQKLSLLAQKWGNISAKGWAYAFSFVNFLAAMHINAPKHLRVIPNNTL
jgi:hypothetical protein